MKTPITIEYKKLIIPIIIMSICLYLIISISGKLNYEEEFCKGYLTSNLSDADYWLNYNGENAPHSCCTENGYSYYTREDGTLTKFIFGLQGRYPEQNCVWVENEAYNKPNIFTKIKHFNFGKTLNR